MHNIKKQRGDTIIEVMIALAVLSLAFGIAYSTANRSLLQARNAQEHSEALQYLSGQVELIRAKLDDSSLFSPGGAFCMDPTTGSIVRPISPVCTITPAGSGADYVIEIIYAQNPINGADQDNFTLTVKWDGVGTAGPQREQLFYKVHQP